MASKTQIRLNQLTGSFHSSDPQAISDSVAAAAKNDIAASDMQAMMGHMASAIKRLHGGSSFSEAKAGVFSQDFVMSANTTHSLGGDIVSSFGSSFSMSGITLGSGTKVIRLSSLSSAFDDVQVGDGVAIGSFRALVSVVPSSTVTFASSFGSSLSTSAMGTTLNSSTSTIPFVSESALQSALGTDIRAGDILVIGSATFAVSSTYSSGASLAVSHTSGEQAVSGISGSDGTLSAAGTSGSPGGFGVSSGIGSQGSLSSSISPCLIGRGLLKMRVRNIEMDGQGRIDLDGDADTSIRASGDDTIAIEVGGSDVVGITASSFDINGLELVLDADADTSIHADTDDQIDFKTAGTDRLSLNASALAPNGANGVALGKVASFTAGSTVSGLTSLTSQDDITLSAIEYGNGVILLSNSGSSFSAPSSGSELSGFLSGGGSYGSSTSSISASSSYSGSLSAGDVISLESSGGSNIAYYVVTEAFTGGVDSTLFIKYLANVAGNSSGSSASAIKLYASYAPSTGRSSEIASGGYIRMRNSGVTQYATFQLQKAIATTDIFMIVRSYSPSSSVYASGSSFDASEMTTIESGGSPVAAGYYADLFLASGAVVNFDGGDVTMTHSGNQLTIAGGNTRVDRLEVDGSANYIDLDGSSNLTATAAGQFVVDSEGDIALDSNSGNIIFNDNGSEIGRLANSSSDFVIKSAIGDQDLILKGVDGSSEVTALTLDMSDAGRAVFNNDVRVGVDLEVLGDLILGAGADEFTISESSDDISMKVNTSDKDLAIKGNDGGSEVTALSFDMSDAGRATFNDDVRVGADAEVLGSLKLGAGADEFVISESSDDITMAVAQQDKDLTITGNDGGSTINALVLDMSEAGKATFNNDIVVGGNVIRASDGGATITMDTSDNVTIAGDLQVSGNDIKDSGGAAALTFDGSQNVTAAANLTVTGDLLVSGNTTTVNTSTLLVKDKLITLNDGGAAASGGGTGIEVEENGSATGFFKVASDRAGWELQAPGNSNTLTIDATASAVLLDVGADVTIDGTLSVEAASVINQDLSSDSETAALAVLTMATRLAADANGGADIGTASVGFGDVYLADDKKLQFGDDQDFTIEYDEDGENVAQLAGANVRIGHGAATELQFRDSALKVYSSTDGQLDLAADAELAMTAPIVDIDASNAVRISNDLELDSDAAVLKFGADSDVSLTHVHDTGLLLNSTMAVQFADANSSISNPGAGLKLADHAVIEVEAATSIQMDSPIVDFEDDGVVLQFGDGDDVTLTHVHDAGLRLNDGMALQFRDGDLKLHSNSDGQLTMSADNALIFTANDKSITMTSSQLTPSDNDQFSLGGSGAGFSDLWLGDGGAVNFGADDYSSSGRLVHGQTSSTSYGIGSDVSSAHKGNLTNSSLTTSTSALTFGSDSEASAFATAISLSGGDTLRFSDGSNTIHYEMSSYGSGSSITVIAATQIEGSAITPSNLTVMAQVTSTTTTTVNDLSLDSAGSSAYVNLNVVDHDGATYGLKLGGTLVTSTAAELNLLDGGTSVGSSVAIANTDGIILNDGGTMKLVPCSDLKTFVGGGRSKVQQALTAQVAADAATVVSGVSHDNGADPDLTDIYVNGQLMMSGSTSATGDYQIHGATGGSSLSSLSLSSQTFSSSTTSIALGSGAGSAASSLTEDAIIVFEGSDTSGSPAVPFRFEATVATSVGSSDNSISVTGAKLFNTTTGAAITDVAHTYVSTQKVAAALAANEIRFFFALEVDDVVTVVKI